MGAGGATSVHVARRAPLPEDGFTGYNLDPNNMSARWGDYSAAAVAPDGSLWMATEAITGGPRTLFANWAMFITHVGDDHGQVDGAQRKGPEPLGSDPCFTSRDGAQERIRTSTVLPASPSSWCASIPAP